MANFSFQFKFSDKFQEAFSPARKRVIESLVKGFSNKTIAAQYDISVKAVEQIVAALNKQFVARGKFFNSRLRIIVSLMANDFLDYESQEETSIAKNINDNLLKTLILCSIGLSSFAIARLLEVSEKTVEQRLSQLYDYFDIDTKNLTAENPRVLLFINSLIKGTVDNAHIVNLVQQTKLPRLERIIEDPEYFVTRLANKHNLVG